MPKVTIRTWYIYRFLLHHYRTHVRSDHVIQRCFKRCLVLLVLLQSHLVFFLCPLVLPLFRILLLHVSGLLLSFYIVCIFFLPPLPSIPLLWSRFHIWILLIFFCPSKYFGNSSLAIFNIRIISFLNVRNEGHSWCLLVKVYLQIERFVTSQ